MSKRNISRLKQEVAKLKEKIKDKDKELMKIRGDHMATCNEVIKLKLERYVKETKNE